MPDQESETLARTFVDYFICRYGCPLEVVTDQGAHFVSSALWKMCASSWNLKSFFYLNVSYEMENLQQHFLFLVYVLSSIQCFEFSILFQKGLEMFLKVFIMQKVVCGLYIRWMVDWKFNVWNIQLPMQLLEVLFQLCIHLTCL